ncbi:MAG: hypothetical protein PHW82_02635 [Bacteroidales bacterium]|nr:hypothetical protein [Bacteroidales bacterium]
MKKIVYSIIGIIIIGIVSACSTAPKDIYGEDIEVDGSGIEMVFKEIDSDGNIVVTISNRMEFDLQEFYARAIWLDEDGNTFEGFRGEPDYFPFQQIDKNMILSGKKDEFVTMLDLDLAPEGTKSVRFELIYAKFEDKSEWKPNE